METMDKEVKAPKKPYDAKNVTSTRGFKRNNTWPAKNLKFLVDFMQASNINLGDLIKSPLFNDFEMLLRRGTISTIRRITFDDGPMHSLHEVFNHFRIDHQSSNVILIIFIKSVSIIKIKAD